jgi:exodeoxyribonuclease VII large subunit
MKEILTVSQLNNNIKLLFEEAFDFIWVEGEVSNLRRPQSGQVYFTLNDDKSLAQGNHPASPNFCLSKL